MSSGFSFVPFPRKLDCLSSFRGYWSRRSDGWTDCKEYRLPTDYRYGRIRWNAGAASELGEAVIVNPNDYNAIARGLKTAWMPHEEMVARNKMMHCRLKRYNVDFGPVSFKHVALYGCRIKSIIAQRSFERQSSYWENYQMPKNALFGITTVCWV